MGRRSVALGLVALVALGVAPVAAQSPSPGDEVAGSPVASPQVASGPTGMPWLTTLRPGVGRPDPQPIDLTAWSGGFAMLDSGRDGWVRLSTDGTTWSGRNPVAYAGAPSRGRIAAYGDGLVVVGGRGRDLVAWRAADGRRWRQLGRTPIFAGDRDRAVGAGVEQLVVVGDRALVRGWVDCPEVACPEAGDRLWGLAGNGRWRELPIDVRGGRLRDVFAGRERFLATVDTGATAEGGGGLTEPDQLVGSRDGRGWEVLGTLPADAANAGALVGETARGFVLVEGYRDENEDGGAILVSEDGTTWTEAWVPPGDGWVEWHDLSVDGDTMLLTGESADGPLAVVSTDGGATWTLSAGWPSTAGGCFRAGALAGATAVAAGPCGVAGRAWVATLPGVPARGVGGSITRGIDPAAIPFQYTCQGLVFTAEDVVSAPDLAVADPDGFETVSRVAADRSLPATGWRLVATDGVRSLAVGTDGRRPAGYVVYGSGGLLVAAGPEWRCATSPDDAIGEWDQAIRLDRDRPRPGPQTQVLHLVTAACPDQRALKPHVLMHPDDVLLQVPISGSASEVGCGGFIRFRVRLPEPLGDRRIWDAAHLPLERIRR
jgi:hypothetical protein